MLRYLMSYPKIFFRFIRPVHAIPKRINGNISKKLHAIWKILFILGSYEFLACLECISRNGLSFGHSDWDISSVGFFNIITFHCYRSQEILAIIKNKGTPNLLNSSDNIDGTQTFLTQLSAVKLESIEKWGKIQTTKMTKFSNLNICSTKREPNPQWPLTATIGLNFWSEEGSPIPMTLSNLCNAVSYMFPSTSGLSKLKVIPIYFLLPKVQIF